MNAYGALIKFRRVDHFMNGLEWIDVGRMGGVHYVGVSGNDLAGAARRIAMVDMIILHAQAAHRHGHPAILITMVMHAAMLANFPADGHALEYFVFENQVAGVTAFGEIAIFVDGFRADGVAQDVILDDFEREVLSGNGRETFNPVLNVELFGRDSVGFGSGC